MATTREERQKVAKRLKDASEFTEFTEEDILPSLISLCGIKFGESPTLWKAMMAQLADLIEPQELDENTSDGYHTFKQLYYQRAMLFSVLVAEHEELAWKTRYHEDGKPCFGGGWFLVTIETPVGPYGYHFEDKYWDFFDCAELPKAKHWDGYDERDVWRLASLEFVNPHEITCHAAYLGSLDDYTVAYKCDACGYSWRQDLHQSYHFCPHCGAKVIG